MPILQWLNREESIRKSSKVPYRLLEVDDSLSYGDKDTENMLIQGDNLDALKALLPYYAGKVKCIFIDPPYNTKSAFEYYEDNLEHTKWLEMMYPRLELLRELLSEDGSIWVTIDDNEAHYLKVIMDEVFGRKNFVTNIVWQKKYTTSNDSKGIPDSHDHILVFKKSEKFERGLLPRNDKQNSMYKYDDGDGRGLYRTDNILVKSFSQSGVFPIINPNTSKEYMPPEGKCWRTNKENMEKWIKENRIYFGKDGKGSPQLKRYLNEVKQGIVPNTWWTFEDAGHNDQSKKELQKLFTRDIFDTPKPEKLIQRILSLATSENDLVLDSFLGSGTTAAVAHKMGRRYIGIEMGEHAKIHCADRLKKVIDGEQGGISKNVNWQGGGGFRFYHLGQPIFDDKGHINPKIKFDHLAAHVWFCETHTPFENKDKSAFLGIHNDVAYYLLYNGILGDKRPHGGNVLTNKILETLPKHDGIKVIYGESSRISDKKLKELNITFKQTPYDVKSS
ncbi:site-specific DNA-methyltransferase [Fastidiosibacter lacustris]|uniref:site-specific DNA-methyltransferase n=1 Tax=Fastidiosibacter lacustris TaxID=2056695 RepID=UPI000E34D3FB|nr:site-specific DNA-methyltransferase [Fastidiosibacter lacustris]